MNQEIKKVGLAKHAFYWGSIFGSIVFLYQVFSVWIKFSGNFFQTLLYSFFVVFALMFCLSKYKRNNPEVNLTFGKSLGLLSIVSLVMSAFFMLFTFVLIVKLQPTLLQDAINQMTTMMEAQGTDISFLTNESFYSLTQIAFVISNFGFDFMGNFFYALFISFIFTRNNTPRYEYYRDITKESDREDDKEEIENKD